MPTSQKLSENYYKARLEKKLELAKETPEPVFDLSDCNLTSVPNNVFSLCKVLRKEAFYLQKNKLTSLSSGGELVDLKNIILLDISKNNFSKLPNNIDVLHNLQVLSVSKNCLTELPKAIGNLQNLVVLNASNNNLQYLPESIGNCQKLETLNISNNEPLKELPQSLGRLRNLAELNVNSTLTYPPPEICKAGVSEILKYLRKELKDTSVPSTSKKSGKNHHSCSSLTLSCDTLQEQIKRQEELKLNKQKERLQFEKSFAKKKEEELKLQENSKQLKSKILEEIKSKEKHMNEELSKLQEKKNEERAALLKQIQEEERNSNETVNKILKIKNSQRLNDSILWGIEKRDEEKYLLSDVKSSRSLESVDVLVAMETLIEEDIRKAQTSLTQKRNKVLTSLISDIISQQDELYKFIRRRSVDSNQLLEAIRKNEELQKVAVTSLLEKSDAASWELAKQISIVQTQLAELTKIELRKKKLEANNQIAQLKQNRIALTSLLEDLFEKQVRRRNVLIEMIEKMEQLKQSDKDSSAFWVDQYNKLFDSKAHLMVQFLESVDQDLVFELFLNEVFQYLPLLKDVALNDKALENLNTDALLKLGINNPEDCKKILEAVESYLRRKGSQKVKPSAPLLVKPSAPSEGGLYSALEECVICLDKKPEVVFLPCGHVCCCFKCFASIAVCPLCRKPIDTVHELIGLS